MHTKPLYKYCLMSIINILNKNMNSNIVSMNCKYTINLFREHLDLFY